MCDFQWLIFILPIVVIITHKSKAAAFVLPTVVAPEWLPGDVNIFCFIPKHLRSMLANELQIDGDEGSRITTAASSMCVDAECVTHIPERVSVTQPTDGVPRGKGIHREPLQASPASKTKEKEKRRLTRNVSINAKIMPPLLPPARLQPLNIFHQRSVTSASCCQTLSCTTSRCSVPGKQWMKAVDDILQKKRLKNKIK